MFAPSSRSKEFDALEQWREWKGLIKYGDYANRVFKDLKDIPRLKKCFNTGKTAKAWADQLAEERRNGTDGNDSSVHSELRIVLKEGSLSPLTYDDVLMAVIIAGARNTALHSEAGKAAIEQDNTTAERVSAAVADDLTFLASKCKSEFPNVESFRMIAEYHRDRSHETTQAKKDAKGKKRKRKGGQDLSSDPNSNVGLDAKAHFGTSHAGQTWDSLSGQEQCTEALTGIQRIMDQAQGKDFETMIWDARAGRELRECWERLSKRKKHADKTFKKRLAAEKRQQEEPPR